MKKLDPFFLRELEWLESAAIDPTVGKAEYDQRGTSLLEAATKLPPHLFKQFDALFSALQNRDLDRELTRQLHEQLSSHTPRLVQADEQVEEWAIGMVRVRVPALNPQLGLEAYAAASRRRDADLSGRCACGGEGVVRDGVYLIEHGATCPAADESLRALLAPSR